MRAFGVIALACVAAAARNAKSVPKPWYSSEALHVTAEDASPTETSLVEEKSEFVVVASIAGYALVSGIANAIAKDADSTSLATRMEHAKASIESANEQFCELSVCRAVDVLQEIIISTAETVKAVSEEVDRANADPASLTDEKVEALATRCISMYMLRLSLKQLDFIMSDKAPLKCNAACKGQTEARKSQLQVSTKALEDFATKVIAHKVLEHVHLVLEHQHMGWLFSVLSMAAASQMDPAEVASILANVGGDALATLIVGEPILAASVAAVTQTLELGSTLLNWADGTTEAKQMALAKGSVRERLVNMRYMFCRETASLTVTAAALTTLSDFPEAKMYEITARLAETVEAVCPPAWLKVPAGVHAPMDLASGLLNAAVEEEPSGITEVKIDDTGSGVPKSDGYEHANMFEESAFVGSIRKSTKVGGTEATQSAAVLEGLSGLSAAAGGATGVRTQYRFNADNWFLGSLTRSDMETISNPTTYCPSTDATIAFKRGKDRSKFITALHPDFRELNAKAPAAMGLCSSLGGWDTEGLPDEIKSTIRNYVPADVNRAAAELVKAAPGAEEQGHLGNALNRGAGAIGIADMKATERARKEAARIRSSVAREPYCAVCGASDGHPFALDLSAVRQSGAPIVGVSIMRRDIKADSAGDPLYVASTIAEDNQVLEDTAADSGFFMSRRADLDACYHKHKEGIKTLWEANSCKNEHHVVVVQRDFRIHRSHLNKELVSAMRRSLKQKKAEKVRAALAAAKAKVEEERVNAVEAAVSGLFAALHGAESEERITLRSSLAALVKSPTLETLQALKTFADVLVTLNIDQTSVDKAMMLSKAVGRVDSAAVLALPAAAEALSRAVSAEPPARVASETTSPLILVADGKAQPKIGVTELCHAFARFTDVNKDGKITLDDLANSISETDTLYVGAMIGNVVTTASILDLVKEADEGKLTPTATTAMGQPTPAFVATCEKARAEQTDAKAQESLYDFIRSGEGVAPAEWVLGPHVYEALIPAAAWPTVNRYWAAVAGGADKKSVTFADYLALMQAARPDDAPEELASVVRADFEIEFGVTEPEGDLLRENFFRHFAMFRSPRESPLWRRRVEEEVLTLSLARTAPLTAESRASVSEHFDTSAVTRDGVTAASLMGGAARYRQAMEKALHHGVCGVVKEVTADSLSHAALAKLLPGVDLTTVSALPAACDAWATALLTKLTSKAETTWPLAWRVVAFSSAFAHVNLVKGMAESANVWKKAVVDKRSVVDRRLSHFADPTKTMFVSVAAAETIMDALNFAGPNVLRDEAVSKDVDAISAKPADERPSAPSMRRIVFAGLLNKLLNKMQTELEENVAIVAGLHGILHTVPHELLNAMHAHSHALRGGSEAGGNPLEPARE